MCIYAFIFCFKEGPNIKNEIAASYIGALMRKICFWIFLLQVHSLTLLTLEQINYLVAHAKSYKQRHWKPWSSGPSRRLRHERLWVQIPESDTWMIIDIKYLLLKFYCGFKRPKKQKNARYGHYHQLSRLNSLDISHLSYPGFHLLQRIAVSVEKRESWNPTEEWM